MLSYSLKGAEQANGDGGHKAFSAAAILSQVLGNEATITSPVSIFLFPKTKHQLYTFIVYRD